MSENIMIDAISIIIIIPKIMPYNSVMFIIHISINQQKNVDETK